MANAILQKNTIIKDINLGVKKTKEELEKGDKVLSCKF